MANPQEMLLTDDIEAGAMDQRKQALAMLLLKQLQQNQPSVQAPPGGYNAPGILGKLPLSAVLMNAGAQGFAQSDLASADADMAARRQKTQQDYLSGVKGFNEATDKDAAIAQLMTSQNPMLRQMAEAQAKVMREQKDKEAQRLADLAKAQGTALTSVGQVTDANTVFGAGKPNAAIQGNAPVEPVQEWVTPPGASKGTPPTLVIKNTSKDGTIKATANTPGSNISITNGNERALNKGVADLTLEGFKENLAAAKGAHALNNQLSRLESLSKDGIVSGPATVPLTWLTGMLDSAGLPVDKKRLANTQEFNAIAEQATQALIAGMQGGNRGITGEESKRILAMLPMAANSPEARAQITAEFRRINQRRIEGFSEQAAAISRAMKDGDFGDLEGMLLPPSLGAGKPPTPLGAPSTPPAVQQKSTPAPTGTLPGGQTPDIMKERIKIVQAEFDKEAPGPTKEALGRELARLQQQLGGPAPAQVPGLSSAEAEELAKLRARFSKGK